LKLWFVVGMLLIYGDVQIIAEDGMMVAAAVSIVKLQLLQETLLFEVRYVFV